jgi:MMP 1-O-methyltransferase
LQIDRKNVAQIKGFLDESEAESLYKLVLSADKNAPCLEIGSYCGKSAIYIGSACKVNGSVLFSIDHHCGSEEQQPGAEYFDSELINQVTGKIDTMPFFRRTISTFDLENTVIPIIGSSATIGRFWRTPLALIFIDGGHAYETVRSDYNIWAKHLIPGGFLVFHDIFADPAKGGQAPYQVYQVALKSGLYEEMPMCKSLGILKYKK